MTEQDILEKLCNKIVDVVHETFIRKYYFVKISQSKLGHIFLVILKKRGLAKKKMPYIKKYTKLLVVPLTGINENTRFCLRNVFLSLNC